MRRPARSSVLPAAAAALALALVLPVAPPAAAAEGDVSSFVVSAPGVAPDVEAAVRRATDVLAASLSSVVPVQVQVRTAPGDAPATAEPFTYASRDSDGSYDPTDTLFPIALANALAGRDLVPGGPDVVLTVSSTAPLWTGAGAPPADRLDLTSAVLREVVQAVGLTSSLRRSGDLGLWGLPDDPVGPTPLVADRFVVNASSADAASSVAVLRRAISTTALGTALSSPVYWDGPQARAASGGRRPGLVAEPAPAGVPFVHLLESVAPPGSPDAVLTPDLAPGETARTLGPVVLGMLADLGWAVPALPGSGYTPLAPRRVLDTRSGLGQDGRRVPLGPTGVLDLQVAGGATGVPADATAVVLNITGVAPSAATDLRVYPTPRTPESVPDVSLLNLARGTTRANAVTVPVGADGRVRVRNAAGIVSVLADLAGYYAPSGRSLFHPVSPVRLLDTRRTTARTLGPGQVLDVQVAGVRGVPSGADAVVLGITGVGPSTSTDVRVYPTPASGAAVPVVSNLNLRPGAPVAGVATVRVGANGRVRVRNAAGSVAVLVDLQGWYDDAAAGGLTFRPVSPSRVLDTRDLTPQRLGQNAVIDIALSGRAGIPQSARAVVLNLTGIAASRGTDLRAYPSPTGSERAPDVSNLNLAAGQTAADAVVVATGSAGRVRVRNQSGSVAVAVDATGWFAP